MRCPNLSELPSPAMGRTGWPWTKESPQLPDTMPDACSWPRVSIVTPSYNQAEFIEGTIRSVLLQGYPNLEYIVIDGGSTDGSAEIIQKYEPWLTFWVSERDHGQAHAINKGFQRATGSILAWLNSDDEYLANTLNFVARSFRKQPNIELLCGDCEMIDSKGHVIDRIKGRPGDLAELLAGDFIPQPSAFFHRRAWEAVGGLDIDLRFILDYDLWIRMMLHGIRLQYIPLSLSRFRWHDLSKTRRYLAQFGFEYLAILERLFQKQDNERLKNIRLKAYHHAFSKIVAGYMAETEEFKDQHDEILETLELWIRHLEMYNKDYIRTPLLLAESLYRIGQSYCHCGNMRQGRHFFRMASRAHRKPYKALLGWVITFLGFRPYRWYTTSYRLLIRSLRRLHQSLLFRNYEDSNQEI